ncbi:MAG: Membrane protein [Cenarchaeum symbiont of Oopsacas minuta]|nr:Membrane protein [Cenarchaeum symbiont of Oopsacas minuta]
MVDSSDDVSRLHNKYSITLVTPSSYWISLVISMVIMSCVITMSQIWYEIGEITEILPYLSAGLVVLAVTQVIDSRLISKKEYSKALHQSLYGSLLWALVLLSGLAAFRILSYESPPAHYIGLGMIIFVAFRFGMLTTTLGVQARKAWAIAILQPTAVFVAMIPIGSWEMTLAHPVALGYGGIFFTISAIWSYLTDRAGRPHIKSTHHLVQAYIRSRSSDLGDVEQILEEWSKSSKVNTAQVSLKPHDGKSSVRLVFPGIHPGPYHPVGGSNIPYAIYKSLNSQAMVMHSISDHAMNLPSTAQVDNYITSLSKCSVSNQGTLCTEPVTVQINHARVTGILFGKNAILFLSLSPFGTEDLPGSIQSQIKQYSDNRGFERTLVVDCHNAMGGEISDLDSDDMVKAARSCLDDLISKPAYPLEFGYANSASMNLDVPDLAFGGIGILCLRVNGVEYYIGWSDSNNMENGVREFVVNNFADGGYNLLEMCTSDTHFSHKLVRTRQGYHQFGLLTPKEKISEWYMQIANKARDSVRPASFEVLEGQANVSIMGSKIFTHFRMAVSNSLKLTAIHAIISLGLFLTSFFVIN